MGTKKVSIIIPCRNEEQHIEQCIKQILCSDYGIHNLEIILVEGFSDDLSLAICNRLAENHPQVKVIRNPAQITPVAFNLGINHSTGEYIFITSPRLTPAINYISVAVEMLQKIPEIGCVGGTLVSKNENDTGRIISMAISSPFGVGGNFRIDDGKDKFVDTVTPPVFRRTIFEEIGYFDETLARNQDDDFSYRLIRNGYKILLTRKIYAEYYGRDTYSKLFRQYYQYGYWKVFVNKKHQTITTIRQLFPALFVFFLCGLPVFILVKETRWLVSVILFLYFSAGFYFALKKTKKIIEVFLVQYAMLILHTGYGLGYLAGFFDFAIFRRKQKIRAHRLTR